MIRTRPRAADTGRPPATPQEGARRRFVLTDVLFLGFLALYTAGGLGVLALGVGAILAANIEALHEWFHLQALGEGVLPRAAQRMADGSHVLQPTFQIALDYAFSVLNLALAGLLLWLRPRDRTARFLAVGMIGTAGMFNLEAQSVFEVIPHAGWETVTQAGAHLVAGLSYAYALLLFPDGKPVPRWRGWAQTALFAPVAAVAGFYVLRAEGTARPASLIVLFGLVIPAAGVAAQAYRFRYSTSAAAHQQARLLFWALLPALGIGVYFAATQGIAPTTTEVFAGRGLGEIPVEPFQVFQPVFAIIPIALFVGLVHYRLWDIDRVVNRTLVYMLLTATLGGAYVGTIVLLQQAFRPFTQGQDLAVASSTLAVAAAFGPVRRRIQHFVDRRFYRRRYDAARTIEAFSVRVRNEIELDTLSRELGKTVAETMQPREVSLWIRGPEGSLSWAWTQRPGPAEEARHRTVTLSGRSGHIQGEP